MPSLKALSLRLKAVTSTAKITKAMKMVAASKLRGAETKMRAARPFASSINELMSSYLEPKEEDAPVETKALMAVSSDKGLCGGINSRVVKAVKLIYDEPEGAEPKVTQRAPRTPPLFTHPPPLAPRGVAPRGGLSRGGLSRGVALRGVALMRAAALPWEGSRCPSGNATARAPTPAPLLAHLP